MLLFTENASLLGVVFVVRGVCKGVTQLNEMFVRDTGMKVMIP